MKTPIFILLSVIALSGCATTTRTTITPTDLDPIKKSLTVAIDDWKMKRYDAVGPQLKGTLTLIDQKQQEVDRLARDVERITERLNYIEPKYSEAVGLLWKWRLITIGLAAWTIGSFIWKFRRWFGVAV